MIFLIGEIEATMGTKMPMKAPEAQAYRVNATSILWPSKSENAD